MGRPKEAESYLHEGIDLNESNWREYGKGGAQAFLFIGMLGESLLAQGKTSSAYEQLTKVLSPSGWNRGADPDFNFLYNQSWYISLLGCLEAERGDVAQGLEHCMRARAMHEKLLSKDPGMDGVASDSLYNREAIARYCHQSKKIGREELISLQRNILEERRQLQKKHPGVHQFEIDLSSTTGDMAQVLLDAGRTNDALSLVNDVLPSQERLVQEDRDDKSAGAEIDNRNYQLRRAFSELLARKSDALARTGKTEDAAKSIKRSITLCEDIATPEPCYLYDLARYLALASTFHEKAGIADAAERAVKALQQFIASGFDNPYKLRHDDRLALLRDRPDFQAMVRELEAKVKAEEARR
jgi:hypothetical protein